MFWRLNNIKNVFSNKRKEKNADKKIDVDKKINVEKEINENIHFIGENMNKNNVIEDDKLLNIVIDDSKEAANMTEVSDSIHKKIKNIEEKYRKDGKRMPFFANRELSWLKFNERVIDEADDEKVPLCERLTFVSIFNSNLDEFYMVRVGSLYDQMLLAKKNKQEMTTGFDNKSMMTAEQQLDAVFTHTRELLHKKDKIYTKLMYEFDRQGVKLISFNDVEYSDAVYLENYFNKSILPILSPQVIGKKNPFPFLKNKEIYAVALLGSKNSDKIGLVPCSNGIFDRLIPIPSDSRKYMLVEELILHFLPKIFKKYSVKSKSLIRIIRNADIDMDEAFFDEDMDYRDTMEQLIKERRRLCPVKLEYSRVLDDKVISALCNELKLDKKQVFYSESPLEMSFISKIQDDLRTRKELFYERRVPQNSKYIDMKQPIIDQIAKKDVLLSYPYESMHPFIKLLNEAGSDDRVLSIKMTLYRVAKNSQIVEALIEAAENGKEVVVLVELRARFDEENNIVWAKKLEKAGCHVIYGLVGLKTHCKITLVVRREEEGIRRYVHLGTGNYNDSTAKLYTDCGILTCNEAIGEDATAVFNMLSGYSEPLSWNHLALAPLWLKDKFLYLINREKDNAKQNRPAHIIAKMNSLCDPDVIRALYEAAAAGVKIDLIVRGICCLRTGVEGTNDNISVRSIVGNFLEHARIFYFENGGNPELYMGSADWMPRNLERRVEILFPVLNPELKEKVWHILDVQMRDTVKAQLLKPDGTYEKVDKRGKVLCNAQEEFCKEYMAAAHKHKNEQQARVFKPETHIEAE